jgi:hypothetical protein
MMVFPSNSRGQTHDNWTHFKKGFSAEEIDNDRGVWIHLPIGFTGGQRY